MLPFGLFFLATCLPCAEEPLPGRPCCKPPPGCPIPPSCPAPPPLPDTPPLSDNLVLRLVDAGEANRSGGVCLDGSPPGFYFRNASSAANARRWVIYLMGGAWCGSAASCASRARSHLGSSTLFAPTYPMEGVLDVNVTRNPAFAGWNHALLAYCDGGSFSGDATDGLAWPDPHRPERNMTLFFRGRRVLTQLIAELSARYGLGEAVEVMLAGGSAGGLATFLQADFVATLLPPTVTRYKAVPVSGFFLMHPTLAGEDSFVAAMRSTYALHNASVPAACTSRLAEGDAWRCFFANYSYETSGTPMFPIQSTVDLYQLFAILQAGGWDAGCLNRGLQFANCTTSQLESFNGYAAALLSDWGAGLAAGKATRPGEGAFLESCLEHVAEQSHAMYDGYAIGGVSVQQALAGWWTSDAEPAARHVYRPCALSLTSPHQCNPTCFAHNAAAASGGSVAPDGIL